MRTTSEIIQSIKDRLVSFINLKNQARANLNVMMTTIRMGELGLDWENYTNQYDSEGNEKDNPDDEGTVTLNNMENWPRLIREEVPPEDRDWRPLGWPWDSNRYEGGIGSSQPIEIGNGLDAARNALIALNEEYNDNGGSFNNISFASRWKGNTELLFFPLICQLDEYNNTTTDENGEFILLDTSTVTNWSYAFSNSVISQMPRKLITTKEIITETVNEETGEIETTSSLRGCTSISYGFANSAALEKLPEMDLSCVVNATYLCQGCTTLKDASGIDNLGVAFSSTNFRFDYMFASCVYLTKLPAITFTNKMGFYQMFNGCYRLVDARPLIMSPSCWSKYNNNERLPYASNGYSVDLIDPDGNEITYTSGSGLTGIGFNYCFSGCSNLKFLPDIDYAGCVYTQRMFMNCYALPSATINTLLGVYNIGGMFINCSSLSSLSIGYIPTHDVSVVSSWNEHTLSGCTNLTTITFTEDIGTNTCDWDGTEATISDYVAADDNNYTALNNVYQILRGKPSKKSGNTALNTTVYFSVQAAYDAFYRYYYSGKVATLTNNITLVGPLNAESE